MYNYQSQFIYNNLNCQILNIIYKQLLMESGNKTIKQKQQSQQKHDKQKEKQKQGLTKNKQKRINKKDIVNASGKKQMRLTNYFHANSSSNSYQVQIDPQQAKINELKQQLQAKQKQIEKIRQQKQYYQNKYSCLYMENRVFKSKARQILVHTLQEQAQIKRQNKRRIDPKLGYFIEGIKIFVQGDDVVQMRKYIQTKNYQYQKLQAQLKKCKSEEQKDRIKFSAMFVKKQIILKQKQLKNKQKQIFLYKQRLKLGMKELTCYYATHKWPIIKDSHKLERYLPLQLLGKGGFGQVYKCYDLQEHIYVAIKINSINLNNNDDEMQNILKHVKREVTTHKQLKHKNIAQIKQILEIDKNRIVFVLQYCHGPELSVYLKQKKCIEEKDAKQIIYQIFCALNYLSQLQTKVIHYDLKPSNIIFHYGVIKIVDFGLCKLMDSQDSRMQLTSQGVGTYWYLPPQTFAQNHATITAKVDVWSAGVIFFQLLYGKRPFANGVPQTKIIRQDLITKQAKQLNFPSQNPNKFRISQQAKDFIQQCLCFNPQQRLNASQAFNHIYFKR